MIVVRQAKDRYIVVHDGDQIAEITLVDAYDGIMVRSMSSLSPVYEALLKAVEECEVPDGS